MRARLRATQCLLSRPCCYDSQYPIVDIRLLISLKTEVVEDSACMSSLVATPCAPSLFPSDGLVCVVDPGSHNMLIGSFFVLTVEEISPLEILVS
jgi:hypothetical protein